MKTLTLTLLLLTLAACNSAPKKNAVTPYTSDTCIVMESKLGSMGDPIVKVYNGREVKFCCEPCVEEFEADPEFYFAELDKRGK
jgi:YHS domain-containing protein